MAPQSSEDWVVEMANGRMPESLAEIEEMTKQMNSMGLKGAYNPANVYPGSPFTPTSKPEPEERWIKKSRKKQRELLLKAWPNMSANHRPDLEAYREECTERMLTGLSKFQEAYKWSYINQQDLSSRSLIIFIKSRAQHPPSAFARADVNATHLGTVTHFIPEPAFLPFHTLFLDGDKIETHGRLVSWEEDDAAADLMFTERQFSPGDGLKAFELQEKIYPFLIKCCELILHDFVTSGALLDGNISTGITPEPLATPDLAPPAVTEILPSLATISAEAPYRLPANINFERRRDIFAARLSAAEDYLEHRNDALLDTYGKPHPTGPHTHDFWERVVRNVIGDGYTNYETWFLLYRQSALLCTLKEKYKNEISYDKQLPKEYIIALLKFKEHLKISSEAPIHYLQNIQSSPPFRHHFTRAPQAPGTIDMHIMPKNEDSPFFHKPWGLLLILWDREQRDLFRLSNVIDAFEQLMQDPEESKNISSYIADRFSDLAILSRALYEVDNYQPWAATFDDEYIVSKFPTTRRGSSSQDCSPTMTLYFFCETKSDIQIMFGTFEFILKVHMKFASLDYRTP
ncbi:097abc67-9730-4319-8d27-0b8dd73a7e21-CDS [Sclerotinia trifoliorum]|uniref:097abc67-9730-4319-8d27-0b8dd73a7e21-CDS n=1 Tax=Sclerotinia trifoliorum TaxID=28548 RepID=A0A8H2VVA0_9HELO|nr:097abc67-9730-4319-8d27-0b8dd73a7e21-CDS [Sclerotinia trifoliorum]